MLVFVIDILAISFEQVNFYHCWKEDTIKYNSVMTMTITTTYTKKNEKIKITITSKKNTPSQIPHVLISRS